MSGQHPLLQILAFFTKAGAFVFGSGLAIVPFLHQGVVQQFAWLTEHQFVDAVAVAMITPGPVVITVVFIGYLVAGFAGAMMTRVGIFLPVYLFTIIPAPWFSRNRDNPQLKAFVQGATAAATGAIAGAVIVIASSAIYNVPTAALAASPSPVALQDPGADSRRRSGPHRPRGVAVHERWVTPRRILYDGGALPGSARACDHRGLVGAATVPIGPPELHARERTLPWPHGCRSGTSRRITSSRR